MQMLTTSSSWDAPSQRLRETHTIFTGNKGFNNSPNQKDVNSGELEFGRIFWSNLETAQGICMSCYLELAGDDRGLCVLALHLELANFYSSVTSCVVWDLKWIYVCIFERFYYYWIPKKIRLISHADTFFYWKFTDILMENWVNWNHFRFFSTYPQKFVLYFTKLIIESMKREVYHLFVKNKVLPFQITK